jgi:hypothetical protein
MTDAMPMLHPLVAPGAFDLGALLEHDPPQRWHPEEGDRLVGEVVKVEDKPAFGTTAPVLFVMVEDSYRTLRCGGVVLRGALQALKLKPGEQVLVKYEGKKKTVDGTREYAMYRMAVRRDDRWVVAS